jgi:hypothetical protein
MTTSTAKIQASAGVKPRGPISASIGDSEKELDYGIEARLGPPKSPSLEAGGL